MFSFRPCYFQLTKGREAKLTTHATLPSFNFQRKAIFYTIKNIYTKNFYLLTVYRYVYKAINSFLFIRKHINVKFRTKESHVSHKPNLAANIKPEIPINIKFPDQWQMNLILWVYCIVYSICNLISASMYESFRVLPTKFPLCLDLNFKLSLG